MEDYSPLDEGSEAHWEVVERILFLYAKLNPGQGYVQGMNEIIGPIYYCFASDPKVEWKRKLRNFLSFRWNKIFDYNFCFFVEHAEADCFFTFTKLMSEIRDFFIKSLDEAESGIGHLMTRLMNEVEARDSSINLYFKEMKLLPQYYSFR